MAQSDAELTKIASQLLRDNRQPLGGITKGQVFDTVKATDLWIDANVASWHAALPAQAMTGLTQVQRNWIFAYVLDRRIGRLRVEEDG